MFRLPEDTNHTSRACQVANLSVNQFFGGPASYTHLVAGGVVDGYIGKRVKCAG